MKCHVTLHHTDGHTEVVKDSMLVEFCSPEEAEKIILHQYEHSDDRLMEFCDGRHGEIKK